MDKVTAGIRSDQLKKLAMFFMLMDHIGAAWIEPLMLGCAGGPAKVVLVNVDSLLRCAGRMAFPIFAYQLVVGFKMTKSRVRMFFSILIFAIVSEIPFQLVFYNKIIDFEHQNTMMTLVIGFVVLILLERAEERNNSVLIQSTIIVAGGLLAVCLKTDYDMAGVILIGTIYLLYADRKLMCMICPAVFLTLAFISDYLKSENLILSYKYICFECYSTAAFLMIFYDNGIRRGGRWLKWAGYIFYPLHLFLLYVIGRLVL